MITRGLHYDICLTDVRIEFLYQDHDFNVYPSQASQQRALLARTGDDYANVIIYTKFLIMITTMITTMTMTMVKGMVTNGR